MRRIAILLALGFALTGALAAQTLTSITVSPHFVAEQKGGTVQLSFTCKYSDNTTDTTCAKVGGVTWVSTQTANITVSASGLVSFVGDANLVSAVTQPGPNPPLTNMETAQIIAKNGTVHDWAMAFMQYPGDTWTLFPLPDTVSGNKISSNALTVGATGAIGAAIQVQSAGTFTPAKSACDWSSSNTAVATVSASTAAGDYVTGVAPGTATLTCALPTGNATWSATSNISGWTSPGNAITISVVAGGTGTTTWYVRPDGGTLFSATDANGQCDGKHDAAYPGTGTNQPCGVSTFRNLWADGVRSCSLACLQWVISGGDTVIIEPNGTTGYAIGAAANAGSAAACEGVGQPSLSECNMPPIPSGTAAQHTVIEGSNFASCSADSQKTQLWQTWTDYTGINLSNSAFVDLKCLNLSDQAACGGAGAFVNQCTSGQNYGSRGLLVNAFTSNDTLTDIAIHGLAHTGIVGSPGAGLTGMRVRITGNPSAGVSMDDVPWGSGNISVAGGGDWENSVFEWSGCIEEYPIVHNYPFIECKDQTLGGAGGYGDGWGTGFAEGDWTFKNDTFRYNWQDGLDLLHSALHIVNVDNNYAYANDGASIKIGSAETQTWIDNVLIGNCARLSQPLGDWPEPGVSGATWCRAQDALELPVAETGSITFYHNVVVSYFSTLFDEFCSGGDYCHDATTTAKDNIVIGYYDPEWAGTGSCGCATGQGPGLYFPDLGGNGAPAGTMPGTNGWTSEDYNYYVGMKPGYGFCDGTQGAHDVCADPNLNVEPEKGTWNLASGANQKDFDSMDITLTATSAVKGAGIAVTGVTTDYDGNAFAAPPSEGPLELGSTLPLPVTNAAPGIVPRRRSFSLIFAALHAPATYQAPTAQAAPCSAKDADRGHCG